MSGGNSTHKGEVRSTRLNPQTDRKYEEYRDENELNDSEAVRRLIRRAIESEEEDTLDKLEIDDELRDRVEAAQEDGETLDDAVRRLLRRGVKAASDDGPGSIWSRLFQGALVLVTVGMPAALASTGETAAAGGIILAYMVMIILDPQIEALQAAVQRGVSSAWGAIQR